VARRGELAAPLFLPEAGKALDAIQKQKLTAEWDEKWGKAFIKPDQVVEFAFEAIQAAKKAKR
jgi:hypothetical protein